MSTNGILSKKMTRLRESLYKLCNSHTDVFGDAWELDRMSIWGSTTSSGWVFSPIFSYSFSTGLHWCTFDHEALPQRFVHHVSVSLHIKLFCGRAFVFPLILMKSWIQCLSKVLQLYFEYLPSIKSQELNTLRTTDMHDISPDVTNLDEQHNYEVIWFTVPVTVVWHRIIEQSWIEFILK